MKKIYVEEMKTISGNQFKRLVTQDILEKGYELSNSKIGADLILKQVEDVNYAANIFFGKMSKDIVNKTVCCTVLNNKITVHGYEGTVSKSDYYYKGKSEVKDVEKVVSDTETLMNMTKQLVDYALGKIDKLNLINPLPLDIFAPLVLIYNGRGRIAERARYEALKQVLCLKDEDVEVLCREIKAFISFNECALQDIMHHPDIKEINCTLPLNVEVEGITNSTVVPNCSDSILQNMVKALIKLDFIRVTKNEERKVEMQHSYSEIINTIKKTVAGSLFSKKSWSQYALGNQKQNGVYSLFIPDNSLEDDEVMIPRPENVDINTVRTTINGNEVIIIHSRKAVIVNGSGSKEVRDLLRKGKCKGYDFFTNVELKDLNIREYPFIGDEIIVTRHPITTLMCKLKVVGYTTDGSIRVNSKIMLSLFGDGDGDAMTVSWSKWTDKMEFADKAEINNFCEAAEIHLEKEEYQNNFDINKFLELKPDSENDCLIKSRESGLEQADAKMTTREVTGRFGVCERDFTQSAIINNKEIDFRLLYEKSLFSQILVQAKNVKKDLANGRISDEAKETFLAVEQMVGDTLRTANMIGPVLNKDYKESVSLLSEWKGETVEQVVEEKEDLFNIDWFSILNQR